MSDLVGNPEDRFSHVAAHIIQYNTSICALIVVSFCRHVVNELLHETRYDTN